MTIARTILGLSVGAGLEGVDAVMVRIDGTGLAMRPRVLGAQRLPFPGHLHDAVRTQLAVPARALGDTLSTATRKTMTLAGVDHRDLFAIGLLTPGGASFAAAAETLAEQTGVTVITGFAARDLAAGGRGTPLTPAADWLLYRDATEDRLLIHLGAAASIVFLPAKGSLGGVIAFDAGPCNRFLDALVHRCTREKDRCDVGGHRAVQGRHVPELMDAWTRQPFFGRKPPKAVAITDFDDAFVNHCIEEAQRQGLALNDLLCTATHFVAAVLGGVVRRWLPTNPRGIYLSGGGTRNGFLRQLVAQQFPDETVLAFDDLGVPMLARKAAAAAVLAALTLDGVTGNLPQLTGAAGGRLLGRLVPGDPRNWAAVAAWAAEQISDYAQAAKAA